MSGKRRTTTISQSHSLESTKTRSGHGSHGAAATSSVLRGLHELDMEQRLAAMEKGHKVCKLALLRKWEPAFRRLMLSRQDGQLVLGKWDNASLLTLGRAKTQILETRLIKEVQTLDFKLNGMKQNDKWAKDKDISQNFDPQNILLVAYTQAFVFDYWILLFDTVDTCRMWQTGLQALIDDFHHYWSSSQLVNRWLHRQFVALAEPNGERVYMKHMKPFVQTQLQFKVGSRQLQDIATDQMNYADFFQAYRKLIDDQTFFTRTFSTLFDDGVHMTVANFMRFQKDFQGDEAHASRDRATELLKRTVKELDPSQTGSAPTLTMPQFVDYLFSRENALMDPVCSKVVQDMMRPLSHYWISSSHNTYLTGDQFRSESSVDAYARALLSGCRCIELDCWDGARKANGEVSEIIIYHGYTMVTRLNLRDVLFTIRHYAFATSEYPLILSIEDNCSVPAQRLLAQEMKEILGDYLLTAPVSKDENALPSPHALRRKIIIKHKKLPVDSGGGTAAAAAASVSSTRESISAASTSTASQFNEDVGEGELLSREHVKRGMLHLQNTISHDWSRHVFVLLPDRLCYMLEVCEEPSATEDSTSLRDDDDSGAPSSIDTADAPSWMVRPEEMHITEDWFHGNIEREQAVARLLEHRSAGTGLFLVRNSGTLIGDFALSFLYDERVHHCRIRTKMVNGDKKYYFLDGLEMDTLFELISYYTKSYLATPHFRTRLLKSCPQPETQIGQAWWAGEIDATRAEQLLGTVASDGAFLVRTSSVDPSVFVVSVRVEGEVWHCRLKREGRVFVVNQTIFESLAQLVDFYSTRQFVRDVCLSTVVNEQIAAMATASGIDPSQGNRPAEGCYMDLRDLDKKSQARAIREHRGAASDSLSFPAGALVEVLRKESEQWRGRYLGRIGWFPPNAVLELDEKSGSGGAYGLHAAEPVYQTVDLAGCLVERVPGPPGHSHSIKLYQSDAHWNAAPLEMVLSAQTAADADDWHNSLLEVTRAASEKRTSIRDKEKTLRVALELSNLVVYCKAVPFDPNFLTDGSFSEMCSFVETKLDRLIEKGLIQFNIRQLSRVYPQGTRLKSTNFNPVPMWNAGCHMVALNYQTGDKAMQLNHGRFLANGRSGYVLKPAYMMDVQYLPGTEATITTSCPIMMTVHVVGGRHLARKDRTKGICSPFVEIEVIGLGDDSKVQRTRTITSNGLCPYWDESFPFKVRCPEAALLRFLVEDGDFVGSKTDPFIGQAVLPLDSIRGGFRSVPLLNQWSEPLELATILVCIRLTRIQNGQAMGSAYPALQHDRAAYLRGQHSLSYQQPTPPTPISPTSPTSSTIPDKQAPSLPNSPTNNSFDVSDIPSSPSSSHHKLSNTRTSSLDSNDNHSNGGGGGGKSSKKGFMKFFGFGSSSKKE